MKSGGGGGRRAGVSPKDLKLDILGDVGQGGYRQQWPEWSDKAKDYLSLRLSDIPDFRKTLSSLESKKDPLTEIEISNAKLDPGAAAEMRFFMKNFCTGVPYD